MEITQEEFNKHKTELMECMKSHYKLIKGCMKALGSMENDRVDPEIVQFCKELCRKDEIQRCQFVTENAPFYLKWIHTDALRALELLITKLHTTFTPESRGSKNQARNLCVEVRDEVMHSFLGGFFISDWTYAGEYTSNLRRFPFTQKVVSHKFYTDKKEVFCAFLKGFFGVDPEMVCETFYLESSYSSLDQKKVILSNYQVNEIKSGFDLNQIIVDNNWDPNGQINLSSTKILFGEFIPSTFDLSEDNEKLTIQKTKKTPIETQTKMPSNKSATKQGDRSHLKKRKRTNPKSKTESKKKPKNTPAKKDAPAKKTKTKKGRFTIEYFVGVYEYRRIGWLTFRCKFAKTINGRYTIKDK